MITGYGLAESVIGYYKIWGGDISTKKAIIQGWGNVGAAAGFYLAKAGVKIVAIIDGSGGVINTDGYSLDQVIDLMLNRDGMALRADDIIPFAEANEKIWNTGAEIFLPCAASRLVSKENVQSLINNGLEVISSGANVPFADKEIFFGPILDFADSHVSVIPDFIANCGMARVFAYLMGEDVEITDKAIFEDTSNTIHNALEKVHQVNHAKTHITKKALELSIGQLV
jgi:glutamate dehydrogenase/leucine dehydrogenase